jgi:hypothetical protein
MDELSPPVASARSWHIQYEDVRVGPVAAIACPGASAAPSIIQLGARFYFSTG